MTFGSACAMYAAISEAYGYTGQIGKEDGRLCNV